MIYLACVVTEIPESATAYFCVGGLFRPHSATFGPLHHAAIENRMEKARFQPCRGDFDGTQCWYPLVKHGNGGLSHRNLH